MRGDDARDHFVYRAFDADGGLLYVGCTQDLEGRINRSHRYTAHWFQLAARFRVAGPYTYATARRLERDAIRTERSMFNGDTPEYSTVRRLHSKVVDRRWRWLMSIGIPSAEALTEACGYADALLPTTPVSEPFYSDDTTIPRAQRIDREDQENWINHRGPYVRRSA